MAAKAQQAFNPTEYKQEFTVLAQRAPEEAADVALKWRERFMNQAQGMKKATGVLLEIGAGTLVAGLSGWMDGGYEAEREKAIEDWELSGAAEADTNIEDHPEPWDHAEGVSDPTKFLNIVDKVLVAPLIFGILALFNVGGAAYNPLLRSAALGGFSYWAGNMMNKVAKERRKEALAKADEEEATA